MFRRLPTAYGMIRDFPGWEGSVRRRSCRPACRGMTVDLLSRANNENVLAISLTGDTVEVFSVIKGVFTRTVTSTSRVQAKDVVKWLPSAGMARDVAEPCQLAIEPGALPATWDDLAVFWPSRKKRYVPLSQSTPKAPLSLEASTGSAR